MSIERLVTLLAEEAKLSPTEIADLLWLALRIEPSATIEEEDEPTATPKPVREIRENGNAQPPPPPKREPIADLSTPIRREAGLLPKTALPIWIPDPPLLGNPLAMVRSLRPLLQQVDAETGSRVDEIATVDRAARTQLLIPILEPDREPWFEVVLIVDRSLSMKLWERLADDLTLALRRYGAFRDLRVFEIESEADRVVLRSHPERPPHDPKELIEPNGRRIAIVLSDCMADYWWDGKFLSVLQTWATAMPTAIWQMLPEWMWERTALGRGTYMALRNDIPGADNARLETEVLGLDEPEDRDRRVPVPVMTSEPADLLRWSRMLAGDRREVAGGFLLPQRGGTVPQTPSAPEMADRRDDLPPETLTPQELQAAIARDRIRQFRLLSSPMARRLAMLLAASPAITLPIMRLIRTAMMPDDKSPLPVAEVFLGGLLEKLPDQPPDTDPEQIQYDFIAGVREGLLEVLPKVEAVQVIEGISRYIAQRLGYSSLREFRAFLTSPNQPEPEDRRGLKAFGRVTASILERLGDEYAEFARELRRGAGEAVDGESEFPPLREFEYEPAIITDIQERFEFKTATIAHENEEWENEEWVIHRKRGVAWGYTELLDDAIALDMIAIPGGTFLMGAPETEPESPDRERPQHEVTLQDFYLGRYAVTQAQWRVVANYPQVERELDPDPSRFKGENRPVEKVNWYDATEFCKRLSQKTGRDYRLPSEAQWEYACRAGTQTPFHFGEIITPELANYDGNYTYNDSPKGEYRAQTTDVGQFPANEWGLHEMHGNVWEWCEDDWHSNYEGAPKDGSAWRDGVSKNTDSVLRGGSWIYSPGDCRSACRVNLLPRDYIHFIVGFRVMCASARTPLGP